MANVEPIVSLRHISMQFPGVLANDDVSLDIRPGEVFALVGENGAGKSTLMNILYGLKEPTSGEIYVKGRRAEKQTPSKAIAMGVGMVHQHFKLVPSFTVAENIALCCEPKKGLGLYDFAAAENTVRALSHDFGLEIDPRAQVRTLSVGLQQRVEILKTLHRGADVLILDEPTAVLTPQETDELFRVIRGIVRDKGMTVIIITHKLYEVMAISDRVGVMRAGRLVGVHNTADVNERMLASMMVGREMLFAQLERSDETGVEKICVENLQVLSDRMLEAVRGVSLSVHAGEILGVAAIEGNGQSELVEAITGMRPVRGGSVRVNGQVVTELGSKVDPRVDTVTVDGREVRLADGSVYLMLNKPAGYVTTMRDPGGRPCVAELVPSDRYPGLFPVGRLDRDTTGLLLFTTDGEAAQRLLHPSYEKDKHYVALVEGVIRREERRALERGITLDDGPCAPAKVEFIERGDPRATTLAWTGGDGASLVGLTIHEGRKHQVKRMLSAVGHEVIALHRDTFGPLALSGVGPGQWRMLTDAEREALRGAARGES